VSRHPAPARPVAGRASARAVRALRAFLADGRPHAFAEIAAAVGPLVLPERAAADHRRHNPNSARPLWLQIEHGRTAVVGALLTAMVRDGRVRATGGFFLRTRTYQLAPPPNLVPLESLSRAPHAIPRGAG